MEPQAPRRVRAAIVGSGFSGLGIAIGLKRAGIDDFVLFERASDLGGTWRDNIYPGCQCDVPSHLYSFSFHPNPNWTRTYSMQPEIFDYLRDCAQQGDVMDHIRFDHRVTSADWDDRERLWVVHTDQGDWVADALPRGRSDLWTTRPGQRYAGSAAPGHAVSFAQLAGRRCASCSPGGNLDVCAGGPYLTSKQAASLRGCPCGSCSQNPGPKTAVAPCRQAAS